MYPQLVCAADVEYPEAATLAEHDYAEHPWHDELNGGLQPGDVTRGSSQFGALLCPGHNEEHEGLACRERHILQIQAKNLTDGFTKCPVCESLGWQSCICHSVGRSFSLGPLWAYSTSPLTVALGNRQRWAWGCTCGKR